MNSSIVGFAKYPSLVDDADFKKFTHENLPQNGKFSITDIDAVVRHRIGKKEHFQLIEIKRQNADLPASQKVTYAILSNLIRAGIKATKGEVKIYIGSKLVSIPVQYEGRHVLQLSNSSFEDSLFTWDKREVPRDQLIKLLRMQK